MSRDDEWKSAIREHIAIPPHIAACASACYYDLMHGPSFSRIPWGNIENFTDDDYVTLWQDVEDEREDACGDMVEETYTSQVGNALRDFLDDLPYELWVDTDCGCVMEREPDWTEKNTDYDENDDESGPQYFEIDMSNIWHLGRREIIEALFGRTIAREFS